VPGEVEVCDVTTGEGGATDEDYANAALIVLLRNSVPQILSSLEELSRLKAGGLSAPAAPREREMDQLTEDFVFEWFGWELMHSREAEDMRTMLKPYFVRALAPSTSGGK
jgi:hypothetical protein